MLRLLLALVLSRTVVHGKTPHLIFFVIDDLGFNDVGYHGSDFPTPNIDKLATQEGVRLERFYAQQICSPSRAALISGRYPFRTGMQHRNTTGSRSNAALPLNATTLAEALGKVGYRTHALGKWHIGHASWNYTPVGRGFESFAGYLLAQNDYYTHTTGAGGSGDPFSFGGFDFWRNKTAAKDTIGKYAIDFYMEETKRILDSHNADEPLFLYFAPNLAHIPLQTPPEKIYVQNCAKINESSLDAVLSLMKFKLPAETLGVLLDGYPGTLRHIMCSMVSRLDKLIGDLVDMLKAKGLWEDTVMWVVSDNGGMTHWGPIIKEGSVGCNYPLRGGKATLFEGGVRVVNFVTGGMSAITAAAGGVRWEYVQHVDMTATFAALGGANLGEDVDGFDVWNVIVEAHQSPRTEVPLNIDTGPPQGNYSALIQGKWKLIETDQDCLNWTPHCDGWWPSEPYKHVFPNSSQVSVKIDGRRVMLFDIVADPQETKNVAVANLEIVRKMLQRINELADPSRGYRPPQDNWPDLRAGPEHNDGLWAPWLDKESQNAAVTVFM